MPMSPEELAAILDAAADRLPARFLSAAETMGTLLETRAAGYLGHLQDEWQPLADSTQAEKQRLGFDPPDFEPLLRSGKMQSSIQHEITADAPRYVATVGSNDPVAYWQEFGTARIPPRPFISLAVIKSVDDGVALVEHIAGTLFEDI